MAFDKTITCTIVDDSDKDNGRYRVTDGSSKFIAYSETKTFRNKDIVYVTIPKGDFGEQKVIIGKKTEIEEEPFNYVRPFDNFLPCTNNIWEDINFNGLIAAGRDENAKPQKSELYKSFDNFKNHYKGFTHLGIKANFKSLLAAEQIASGNYGIRLEMKCVVKDVHSTGEYQYVLAQPAEEKKEEKQYYIWNETDKRYEATTATPENNENNLILYEQSKHKTIKKIFDLSCQDMLGNPFAFEIFSNQEKVFDISDIEDILALDIYFYQNGEFKTKAGKDLPLAKTANLFVSNINILFGYSLQNIDDEFVQLFTTDSLNYQHTNDIEQNRKNIDLRWAHKVGDKLQVFTKDNLEAWYDEIFDRNEQNNTPYELLIDSSPQQIENRHYYIPNAEKDSNRLYTWHQSGQVEDYKNIIVYSLDKKFVPVTEIKEGEWYFKKQTFLVKDFIKNQYFFSGSGDKLDDNLLNYDATIYEKQKDFVTKSFIEEVKKGQRKLSDYIFYLYGQDNSISPVSVNTIEEFLPNKIYCFNTYKEIKDFNFENILDQKNQDYYISLYCPITISEIENEDKINNTIVKPVFTQIDLNNIENIENFYTINTDIFDEVFFTNENKYEPNKYYYRKYKLDEIFEIRWYRYNLGVPAADEFCGLYWERIPECTEGNNKTYTDPGETAFHCSLLPDFLYNKTEQIKAILIIKQGDEQIPYYSNIITFENKNEVVSIPTTEQELALKLRIDDGTFGNYYLYDESNNLIDKSQSSIRKSLTALFNKADFTSNSVLQDATKVTWVFPVKNTMLNINIAETGGTYFEPEPGSAYGKIVIEEKRNSYQLIYNIENTFNFNKNNNSITCTIEKDGEIFSTTQEFSFGNSGSNGSDYTLVLDLLTADNMVTLDPISNVYSFREVQQPTQVDFNNYFVYDENTGYLRKATGEYDKDIKYYICISKDSNGNTTLTKEYLPLTEVYQESDKEIIFNNNNGQLKDLSVTIFKLEKDVYTPVTNFSEITANNWNNYYIANNLEMLYGYYYSDKAFRVLKTSTPVEEIKVRATLYDQSNNKINLNLDNYTFNWSFDFDNDKSIQEKDKKGLFKIHTTENKNEVVLLKQKIDKGKIKVTSTEDTEGTKAIEAIDSLCILTATLSGFGNYDLEAYLPIPLRANYGVIRYQGPDKIIYSTTGVPNYYKDEINLFYNDTKGNDKNYPIFGSNSTPCFSILNNEEEKGKHLLPILETKKEKEVPYIKLIPKSTFIQGLKPFGIQYTDTQQTKIFTQPILNIQNRYFSSTLNKWDGELSVDDNNNTILAKMIGAGRKNSDNTFSGVMLGDWTGSVDANDGGKLSLKEHIGLYGIHKGETSFGFTEQGIGFIGKAGKGRILLDGNNSVITSSDWTLNGEYGGHKGLYIKIDDGFILMRKDSNSDALIKLNVLASGGKDNSNLSDKEKYDENGIQISGNYTNLNPEPGLDENNNPKDSDYPFVIAKDKKNFTKIGWNGNIYLGGTHSGDTSIESGYISLNAAADKYPLDINSHFAVAWNGALTISKQNIISEFGKGEEGKDEYIAPESSKNFIFEDDTRGYGKPDPKTGFEYTEIERKNNDSNELQDKGETKLASKSDNPYDYSSLNKLFHGLHATPDGDMYLSRKLVIGSRFSATADGYLRAKAGLFDDCNANVFQVRALEANGSSATIDLNTPIEDRLKKTTDIFDKEGRLQPDFKGAKIGDMGWLQGSYGEEVVDISAKEYDALSEDEQKDYQGYTKPDGEQRYQKTIQKYTMNLGISSQEGCGIVLNSQSNVRIDSASDRGTYFNGGVFTAKMNKGIDLYQINSEDANYGIRIHSMKDLNQRSADRIKLSVESNRPFSADWSDTEKITDIHGNENWVYRYNTAIILEKNYLRLHKYTTDGTAGQISIGENKSVIELVSNINSALQSITIGKNNNNSISFNGYGQYLLEGQNIGKNTQNNQSFNIILYNNDGTEVKPTGQFLLRGRVGEESYFKSAGPLSLNSYGATGASIKIGIDKDNPNILNIKSNNFNLTKTSLIVENIPAKNQKGIYARFA